MIARIIVSALVGAALLGAPAAKAQDYPSKPVRIVVGFAAGGIADLGARLLADYITRTTGQQAVVENRSGAAGTLAADTVAKAAPDGYTIGVVLNGQLVINPFVQKQMPYDALKDLLPVAGIGDAPQMIAMTAELPAKDFKEFQALAKAKPGVYTYGSAGVGSLPHLSAAEFTRQAGVQMIHVPYRGNAPAMTDLLAGRIHLISASIGTFRAGIAAGKLRILLTATKQRLPYSQDVPTSAEVGIPNYLMSVWVGMVAPAGTPQPVVQRLHALVQGMQKHEPAQKAMAAAGLELMTMSQPEFASFVKADHTRWEAIVKNAGVEKQ